MAIKKEPNGTFTVSYYKRHPITRVPIRIVQRGVATHAEAKRTLMKLAVRMEQKLHEQIVPKWNAVIDQYIEDCRFRGLSEKTINSTKICIEAHTLEHWSKRPIDSITREEISALHKASVGDKSQGHQKYMMKCFRLVF